MVGPILPVLSRWKVSPPGIGPSIYQPSPNVTKQMLDHAYQNIRLRSTHMESTGNIVYGHWSNDKSKECSTHGSSCPAEVQVSIFTLFSTLDTLYGMSIERTGYHSVKPINGRVILVCKDKIGINLAK